MDSLTLKRHNCFQSQNNRKAKHAFAPRPLMFKLKQEVLKFIDICMSLSFPKIDLETNFLNLENRSFENVSFSQQNNRSFENVSFSQQNTQTRKYVLCYQKSLIPLLGHFLFMHVPTETKQFAYQFQLTSDFTREKDIRRIKYFPHWLPYF